MNTYRVSYYKRNPIDPQSRWTIHRENVTAASAEEARRIIEDCDCEVIEVEDWMQEAILDHADWLDAQATNDCARPALF